MNASASSRRRSGSLRWYMLGLLFLITVLSFIDRQALPVVAPVLRERLHLSATGYGVIVASFQFGMLLGEFPMGVLMDRRGVRFGLCLAVLWWSLATSLQAAARSVWQFCLCGFWQGAGQSGNFPGGVKALTRWFPARERGLAIGIFNGGCLVGSMIAPPLLVLITLRFGWPAAFYVPGGCGILLALVWMAFYRDIREGAPVEHGTAVSSRELLHLPQTWGVMLARMLAAPVFYVFLYWLPDYLYRERGLSLKSVGLLAWLPYLFGGIGSVGGGWLAALLMRRGMSTGAARRATMAIGAGCCLLTSAIAGVHTWQAAIALISIVLAGQSAFSASTYAVISDVFPADATARVMALTGIANDVMAMLFPLLTGWMVDRFSYAPVFLLTAVMPVAGWAALVLLSPAPTRSKH